MGGWHHPFSSSVPLAHIWGWEVQGEISTVLSPSPPFPTGICTPQSQHRCHPKAALGKDMLSEGRWTWCHQVWVLTFPPLVPSQLLAWMAEKPWLVGPRVPNARPAPRGNGAG